MSHACPICGASLQPQSRCPRHVCAAWARRAGKVRFGGIVIEVNA